MALTDEEKVKTRHHLGYLNAAEAQTFVLGFPVAVQTQFMVEGAMQRVLAAAEDQYRVILARLDAIEAQIVENTENLAVESIDEIKINPKEFEHLLNRYMYWRTSLANLLGIQPNPYDQRFGSWGGGGMLNARVNHG